MLTLSDTPGGAAVARKQVDILVDPFGIAFDSRDGTPVSEVRITLIDAATGQPALVFGDDGISSYPSTIVTGQSVTDSGGMRYDYPAGDYRFPLVRPGRYRLRRRADRALYGAVDRDRRPILRPCDGRTGCPSSSSPDPMAARYCSREPGRYE